MKYVVQVSFGAHFKVVSVRESTIKIVFIAIFYLAYLHTFLSCISAD